MLKMYVFMKTLFTSKKGQGMVEYGLIIGLVAIAVITVLGLMSGSIGSLFDKVKTSLDGAAAHT